MNPFEFIESLAYCLVLTSFNLFLAFIKPIETWVFLILEIIEFLLFTTILKISFICDRFHSHRILLQILTVFEVVSYFVSCFIFTVLCL